MAYDSLKNIIRQYIKTNGEQEITGQIMQNVLIEMVNNYPSTEGYIRATLSNLANGDILVYDSVGAWYNTPMSSFLAGYATQLWVNQQGYVTSSALAGYIHPTLTDLANGDILVYDSGVNWVNTPLDTTISGFGYVKSTGSVAYATSAGSANILGHTVYENPAHALANGDMLVYDSGTGWTNVETSSILSGYATQSWVTSQGYITSSALNGYIHPTLTNLANGDVLIYDSVGSWVNAPLDTTIAGFGYITSSALSGYATESWVGQQGYITSSGSCAYATSAGDADTVDGLHSSSLARQVNNTGINANNIQDGLCGGKLYEAANWPFGYYAFLSAGYGKAKLQFNARANVLYFRSGSEHTIDYAWKEVAFTDSNVASATTAGSATSADYATSAGSANILGHSVTLNSAHSLSNGDILVYDSVGSWTNVSSGLSDIRQKDVINYNAEPTFEAVANAPAIKFTYKDNTYSFRRGVHIGSIAQYWQTTLPETVTMDNDGMLSMKYDVIALLSTISVAKKVSEHERRIVILERENEELRKELAALKSA